LCWLNLKPGASFPKSCADDTTDSEAEEMPIEDADQLARSLATTLLNAFASKVDPTGKSPAGSAGEFQSSSDFDRSGAS